MLLDSTLIIYTVKPDYPEVRSFVKQHHVAASSISQTETLGYHDLDDAEAFKLERLFILLAVQPSPSLSSTDPLSCGDGGKA